MVSVCRYVFTGSNIVVAFRLPSHIHCWDDNNHLNAGLKYHNGLLARTNRFHNLFMEFTPISWIFYPSQNEVSDLCWINVGRLTAMLTQHQTKIES